MAIKLTITRVPGRAPASAALDGAALSAIVAIDRDGIVRVQDSAFDEATQGAEGLHSLVLGAEQGHWNEARARQALLTCLDFPDWAALRKAVGGKGRVRCEIVGREVATCQHTFVADGNPDSGAPDYCSKCGEVRVGCEIVGREDLGGDLTREQYTAAVAARIKERSSLSELAAHDAATACVTGLLESIGESFGCPAFSWTADAAREVADEELSCWEVG